VAAAEAEAKAAEVEAEVAAAEAAVVVGGFSEAVDAGGAATSPSALLETPELWLACTLPPPLMGPSAAAARKYGAGSKSGSLRAISLILSSVSHGSPAGGKPIAVR
jgi:hypothetical protein